MVIEVIAEEFLFTVMTRIREGGQTTSPVSYNGIEPDTTGCYVRPMFLECGEGEGVLSDGDIGPTDSVDVSDPDQVHRFFVWHRDNGTVQLQFFMQPLTDFTVSYVDIYTLRLPSDNIDSPGAVY